LRKAKTQKITVPAADFKLLRHPAETALMKELLRLPEVVEDTARDYQIQRLCLYATELAASFHKFYGECPGYLRRLPNSPTPGWLLLVQPNRSGKHTGALGDFRARQNVSCFAL